MHNNDDLDWILTYLCSQLYCSACYSITNNNQITHNTWITYYTRLIEMTTVRICIIIYQYTHNTYNSKVRHVKSWAVNLNGHQNISLNLFPIFSLYNFSETKLKILSISITFLVIVHDLDSFEFAYLMVQEKFNMHIAAVLKKTLVKFHILV